MSKPIFINKSVVNQLVSRMSHGQVVQVWLSHDMFISQGEPTLIAAAAECLFAVIISNIVLVKFYSCSSIFHSFQAKKNLFMKYAEPK